VLALNMKLNSKHLQTRYVNEKGKDARNCEVLLLLFDLQLALAKF